MSRPEVLESRSGANAAVLVAKEETKREGYRQLAKAGPSLTGLVVACVMADHPMVWGLAAIVALPFAPDVVRELCAGAERIIGAWRNKK